MVITELPKRRAGVVLTKDTAYSQRPLVLSRDSFSGHIVAKLCILQSSAQHGQAMSWGKKPRSHSVVIHNSFFLSGLPPQPICRFGVHLCPLIQGNCFPRKLLFASKHVPAKPDRKARASKAKQNGPAKTQLPHTFSKITATTCPQSRNNCDHLKSNSSKGHPCFWSLFFQDGRTVSTVYAPPKGFQSS